MTSSLPSGAGLAPSIRQDHGSPAAPGYPDRIELDGLTLQLFRGGAMEEAVDGEALLRGDHAEEPPYWMHLWPGAKALARIVARAREIRPGALVIELGCGLALPSITAAVRGASVVTTDSEPAPLALAKRSARRNRCRIHAVQMDFRHPSFAGTCDVLLGAEIGYDDRLVTAVADAVERCLRRGGTAWFADSVNTYRSAMIDGLVARGLRVQVRSRCEWEEGRRVWVRLVEARRP